MNSKLLISLFYAFALTCWPPDKGISQVKEIPDTVLSDEFDSAVFYELVEEKAKFKIVAGSTKSIQREAFKELAKLERKPTRVDTFFVPYFIPMYDTVSRDTPKHKRNLFHRIFK